MMPAHSLRSLVFVLVAPMLPHAPVADPKIQIGFQPYLVTFDVSGPDTDFVGVVLVSLSSDLQHFFTGLPPLLADSIVLDWGAGQNGTFHSEVSEFVFPAGVFVYAQGVTISEAGIQSSGVGSFVLDVTSPK